VQRVNRRAGWLATTVLLVGCVPARWPDQADAPPTRLPPAASSRKPAKPVPAPQSTPAPATTAPAPPSGAGNPPFYEVYGERYFVMPESGGYREQGVASWYGAQFHGKRTSSGVIYDMHGLTAAHKTLPLPSLVRVTNLDTGRSVVVTVNDRGPFVKNRLIDLSYAAAMELGIVKSGTGRVEVEAVVDANTRTTGAVAPGPVAAQRIYLQVGAFGDEANAARLKGNLESNGVNKVVIRYDEQVSPALYRVRVGPLSGSAEYDALAARMASLEIPNPRLVTESPAPRGLPPAP